MAELKMHRESKKLSIFIDEVMEGSKQLSDDELVKLGRDIKKGRYKKLEQ